jgi:hypothetical protein
VIVGQVGVGQVGVGQVGVGQVGVGQVGVGQVACRSSGLSVKWLSVKWVSVKWLSVKWPGSVIKCFLSNFYLNYRLIKKLSIQFLLYFIALVIIQKTLNVLYFFLFKLEKKNKKRYNFEFLALKANYSFELYFEN